MDKKNIVRWIMDIFGGFIAVYVLWSVNKINDLVESDFRQGVQIEQMQVTLSSIEISMERIVVTLDAFVFSQALDAKMKDATQKDRWTAGMMEVHDDLWLGVLQEKFPDACLTHKDVPDVKSIQKRFGF